MKTSLSLIAYAGVLVLAACGGKKKAVQLDEPMTAHAHKELAEPKEIGLEQPVMEPDAETQEIIDLTASTQDDMDMTNPAQDVEVMSVEEINLADESNAEEPTAPVEEPHAHEASN